MRREQEEREVQSAAAAAAHSETMQAMLHGALEEVRAEFQAEVCHPCCFPVFCGCAGAGACWD